jgi:diaphanous 2
MIEIPRLEKRLEMFQWKLQLEPSVAELRKSLAALAAACEEVKSSKRLPVLLKAVLIIGQVLNRDSYLFISDGFRIESLMKVRTPPRVVCAFCVLCAVVRAQYLCVRVR